MTTGLHPTLWRTCRALANHGRLDILSRLGKEGEQTVSRMAEEIGRPVSAVSENMRILNARGLLKVRRRGKHVYYRVGADSSISHAGTLLSAVARTLRSQPDGPSCVFKAVTSVTHPRRIIILSELHRESLPFAALSHRCKISKPALNRHLLKLQARGLIIRGKGVYRLAKPKDALRKCLLNLTAPS